MSKKIHSQDSNSDPRNEEDYDTWEYGTEPIPHDHTWTKSTESTESDEFARIWKEMDEIEPLTPIPQPSEDIKEASLAAYQEAAASDDFLFGAYDAYDAYTRED